MDRRQVDVPAPVPWAEPIEAASEVARNAVSNQSQPGSLLRATVRWRCASGDVHCQIRGRFAPNQPARHAARVRRTSDRIVRPLIGEGAVDIDGIIRHRDGVPESIEDNLALWNKPASEEILADSEEACDSDNQKTC